MAELMRVSGLRCLTWRESASLVEVYSGGGESALTANRSMFRAMLDRVAEDKTIAYLVVQSSISLPATSRILSS